MSRLAVRCKPWTVTFLYSASSSWAFAASHTSAGICNRCLIGYCVVVIPGMHRNWYRFGCSSSITLQWIPRLSVLALSSRWNVRVTNSTDWNSSALNRWLNFSMIFLGNIAMAAWTSFLIGVRSSALAPLRIVSGIDQRVQVVAVWEHGNCSCWLGFSVPGNKV